MFQSQKAEDAPCLVLTLESMKVIALNPRTDLVNDNSVVEIEPGSSVFHFKNCAVQAREILDSGEVNCEMFQSSNAKHAVGSCIQNFNVETFKNHILYTYDSKNNDSL